MIEWLGALEEAELLHQVANDLLLRFQKRQELVTGVVDVYPTVPRTHSFPFRGLVHLADGILVHGQFIVWQTWGRKEPTPVNEARVDALLFHRHCVWGSVNTLV